MLENIAIAEGYEVQTLRYVGYSRIVETIESMDRTAMDMNDDDVRDIIDFLNERNISDNLERVVDAVFSDKARIDPKTRFSDGTRRVFYSGLETATIDAEVMSWYLARALPNAEEEQLLHYCRLSCRFLGALKDLRPHLAQMPFLVADDGYSQCHLAAAEAVAQNLDALLTPSARNRPTGNCLPVFTRKSLNDATLDGHRRFRVNPVDRSYQAEEI